MQQKHLHSGRLDGTKTKWLKNDLKVFVIIFYTHLKSKQSAFCALVSYLRQCYNLSKDILSLLKPIEINN